MKHLESPASFALAAGNIPDHARHFFGDDFIELGMDQSDDEIVATLRKHLNDKDRLLAMTKSAHERITREHSTDVFAEKVVLLLGDYLAKSRTPTPTPTDQSSGTSEPRGSG